MISLLFARQVYSEEVCLVGLQANKGLCPTGLTNRYTFAEVPDSTLQIQTTFVICGEVTQQNQGDVSSTSASPIVNLISRSSQLAKAQNIEMPLLTFTSLQDTRQKILLSDVSDSLRAKCAFINIDFIQGQTKLFAFLDLTLVASLCTSSMVSTSLVVERTLTTDICSITCWEMQQSQSTSKINIILNSENEIENQISSSAEFKVNFRASITVLNAHQFKEVILSQSSSSIDLTVVSTKDIEFTINGYLYFDDCSIDINFGEIITSPAIINFESSRAYTKTTFPKINFQTTKETTISVTGEWAKAKDSIQSIIDTRLKAVINHKTNLILSTASFRPQITHNDGNLTIQLDVSACTINQQLIESSANDCFVIFTPSGKLEITNGISLRTLKIQLHFTHPQEFSLILGTIDCTRLGSFSVFPLKFRMYRSRIGRIAFPSIKLTNTEQPALNANQFVVIDPDVSLFPTLTQYEIQRLTPDAPQTFINVPSNSGFGLAQIIFPVAQNQVGFWKDSSILVTSTDNTTELSIKATIDGEKRKSLPLNIALGNSDINGYFTAANLPSEKLSALITDVTKNVNILIQENADTYIDFHDLNDASKASANFSITGISGKTQNLKLLNTNTVTGQVNIKNTVLDCNSDFTIAFKSVTIENCYFTANAARLVQFAPNCNINVIMNWGQFVSFGINKKTNGPVDFSNANLRVTATGLKSLIFSSIVSVYPENSNDKFDISLNDPNHVPVFDCLPIHQLLIKSNDGSLTTKGIKINIGGNLRIEGSWTYKVFQHPIQLEPKDRLNIVLTDKSLPEFSVTDNTRITYYLDNDFAYSNFKNKVEIDFPTWFIGNMLNCTLSTLDNNFAVSVSPQSNKVLFETLSITEGATINMKTVEIRQKLIVNKEAHVIYEGDSDNINSIEVKWNVDKSFPVIELLGKLNTNSIYFNYVSSTTETVHSYNTLFNNSISGTQSYGVSVIKSNDILLPSLFSFSLMPDHLKSAQLSVLSSNSYFYVTSSLITEGITTTPDVSKTATPEPKKAGFVFTWWMYAAAGGIILIIMIVIGVSVYKYQKNHQTAMTIGNDPDYNNDTKAYIDVEQPNMMTTKRRVRKTPVKAPQHVSNDESEYYYEYTYEYITEDDYVSDDSVSLPDITPIKKHPYSKTPQSIKSLASQRSLPPAQGLTPVKTSKSAIKSPMKSPIKSPAITPHPPAAFSPNKFISPRGAIVVSMNKQQSSKRPEILKNDENMQRNNIPKPQFILVPENYVKPELKAMSEGRKRRNSAGEEAEQISNIIHAQGFMNESEKPAKSSKTPQIKRMRRCASPRRSMTPNEMMQMRDEIKRENYASGGKSEIRRISTSNDDEITPRRTRKVAPPSSSRVATYISPRNISRENVNTINVVAGKSPKKYVITPKRDSSDVDVEISTDESSDVSLF